MEMPPDDSAAKRATEQFDRERPAIPNSDSLREQWTTLDGTNTPDGFWVWARRKPER